MSGKIQYQLPNNLMNSNNCNSAHNGNNGCNRNNNCNEHNSTNGSHGSGSGGPGTGGSGGKGNIGDNSNSNCNNMHNSNVNNAGNNIENGNSGSENNGNYNNNNSSYNNSNNSNNGNSNNCSNTNNNNGNNSCLKNRICRNFVRGLCRRKHCKYPHVLSPDLVVFCHDFQNSNCPRMNCKFLHYTLEEEEYYRKYGEFPQDYMINDNPMNSQQQNAPQQIHQNAYKEYGFNYIGGSCRHRDCFLPHSPGLDGAMQREMLKEHPPPPSMWSDHVGYRIDDRLIPSYRGDNFKSLKRNARDSCDSGSQFKRYRDDGDRCIDLMALIRRFEEEQVMLRRRVEANEIKIAELRATNEYLVAQSAQLRLNNQVVQQQQHQQHQQQSQQVQVQQQTQQCSTVVNPVTVTQTTTQPQVIGGAVSIAPVQVQATPIVSIATPQTQIISSGTPLAIAAANTSQGQQLAAIQQNITSLSNTTQPIPPAPPQLLGTSQITLTPAIAQGASMGLTINTSQALAMSNATQPNISYPVMTHSILPHCNN